MRQNTKNFAWLAYLAAAVLTGSLTLIVGSNAYKWGWWALGTSVALVFATGILILFTTISVKRD